MRARYPFLRNGSLLESNRLGLGLGLDIDFLRNARVKVRVKVRRSLRV